jgi:hypothetical protein
MTEAAYVRVVQRLFDALGQLPPRGSLPCVDAGLYPVELGQDVIGKIEPPVGEDVALDPAQHAERCQQFVRGADLLCLPAHVVCGESPDGAHGGRVIADGEIVIAALLSGAGHLLDGRLAV